MTRMPQVTPKDIISFLKGQGFEEVRQEGSHVTLWSGSRRITVTVPFHSGCDLGRGLAVRILKDAGFSVDDFLRLR
jgi:predicted RNA binding protein YcfA (HicA-like mRNA interferase family)